MFHSVVNDTQGGGSARGYAIAGAAAPVRSSANVFSLSSLQGIYAASFSYTGLPPAASGAPVLGMYDPGSIPNVVVTVALPLNRLYSATIYAESELVGGSGMRAAGRLQANTAPFPLRAEEMALPAV